MGVYVRKAVRAVPQGRQEAQGPGRPGAGTRPALTVVEETARLEEQGELALSALRPFWQGLDSDGTNCSGSSTWVGRFRRILDRAPGANLDAKLKTRARLDTAGHRGTRVVCRRVAGAQKAPGVPGRAQGASICERTSTSLLQLDAPSGLGRR